MSLHKSLRSGSALVRKRNVLNREERLARLTELGKWDEGKDSVYHLPKTRIAALKKLGKKKKKEKKEEAAAAEGAAAAPAAEAKPAAKAAKGGKK